MPAPAMISTSRRTPPTMVMVRGRSRDAEITQRAEHRAARGIDQRAADVQRLRHQRDDQRRQEAEAADHDKADGRDHGEGAFVEAKSAAAPFRKHDREHQHDAGGQARREERDQDDECGRSAPCFSRLRHPPTWPGGSPSPLRRGQSVIAIARSACRSRAESFSVSDFSCPQAARISRPRGVRTGEE